MSSKPLYGFRFAEIHLGDTLQLIAYRELGDANRWAELIAFNGLVAPFLAAVASVGVLAYGDYIRVPASTPVVETTTSAAKVFGIDVMLINGDLAFSAGDFAVVVGRDNLRQAIGSLLVSDRGDLIFHPDYGTQIRRMLGSVNGPAAELLAESYTRSALLADPRVKSVNKIVVTSLGDSIGLSVEITPVSGQSMQITV